MGSLKTRGSLAAKFSDVLRTGNTCRHFYIQKRRTPSTAVSQGSVFHPPLLSRCSFPQRDNQISKLQNTNVLSLRGLVFWRCILKDLLMKR